MIGSEHQFFSVRLWRAAMSGAVSDYAGCGEWMWQNFLGLMCWNINRIRYIMPTKWYLGVGMAICCVGYAGCQTLECWARVSGYQGLQSVAAEMREIL